MFCTKVLNIMIDVGAPIQTNGLVMLVFVQTNKMRHPAKYQKVSCITQTGLI